MKKDPSERLLPKFTDVESHVFTEHGGAIYIGKEKITEQLRGVLRDEAEYIQKSRLWEVLNATVTNEAYTIALIQSANYEHVLNAKQLHHWAHVMRNVIHILAKK